MPPDPHLALVRTGDDTASRSAPTSLDLGARVRELRTESGWSLDDAAVRIGLSRSSLYKIEKGKMSPTFDTMKKLADGFDLDIQRLLGATGGHRAAGRRSVTRRGDNPPCKTDHYDYRPLAEDLAHKAMLPFELVVRARSLDDFADWDRHDTEEFCHVLSGTMALYTECYEPVTLKAGDSIYYDGRMGHACVSVGSEDAAILWVSAP
ncbi:MAG: helix-turn-helix transcriptional regulator [Rhodospirillales bacterium]|nr:helix-turn-helix transcriptional regulator [Rhodospirillales bacterium]